jgi:ABC-type transporter Mla maintaining outer membrane lipid asymmetry ATPase subunit MlaF
MPRPVITSPQRNKQRDSAWFIQRLQLLPHPGTGEQVVLNGTALEVARGETVTVLGRSRTGKSVFLKLISGLQKPDGGRIEINGQDVTRLPLDELNQVRKKIGFLFQNAASTTC